MNTRTLLITIPLTLAASFATVVACGPTKSYVSVNGGNRNGTLQTTGTVRSLGSCRDKLSASKSVRQTRTNTVCEASNATTGGGDDGLGAPPASTKTTYSYNTSHAVGYYISKNASSKISVQVPLGLSLGSVPQTGDVLTQMTTSTTYFINSICGPQIEAIWARSGSELVNLDLKASMLNAPSTSSPDELDLDYDSAHGTDTYPALVMREWPDRAVFYPFGRQAQVEACAKKANPSNPTDKNTIIACERADRGTGKDPATGEAYANGQFCAALSIAVGHLAGITSNDPKLNAPCAAASPSPAPAAPASTVTSTYMTASALSDPTTYFANAKLSKPELQSVLQPVCQNLTATSEVEDSDLTQDTEIIPDATVSEPSYNEDFNVSESQTENQ